MTFFIIIILLVVLWPWITKWVKGFMSRRAEDAIRRMMGMPSRREEQRRRKESERKQSSTSQRNKRTAAAQEREADRREAVRSMKENAVDVEYTEYKEYSQTEISVENANGKTRIYTESQVTDAEFVEIKDQKNETK